MEELGHVHVGRIKQQQSLLTVECDVKREAWTMIPCKSLRDGETLFFVIIGILLSYFSITF